MAAASGSADGLTFSQLGRRHLKLLGLSVALLGLASAGNLGARDEVRVEGERGEDENESRVEECVEERG